MSKQHDVSGPTAADQAPGIHAGTPQLASPRRRRLIKLGAGAVPVALTLTSRPVMAWHCNTTSAWGSAILQNGGASVQTRYKEMRTPQNEGWYVSGWGKETAGWKTIGKSKYGQKDGDAVSYAQSHLKVKDLYPNGVGKAGKNTKVRNYLEGAQANDFGACLLAAKLNLFYASGSNSTASCLSPRDDVNDAAGILDKMAACTYAVNGKTWDESAIVSYLRTNYMA